MNKKNNKEKEIGIIQLAVFILISIIIEVFVALLTTASDKNTAEKQMNAVSQYVKEQCIRCDELVNEDTSRSLYEVSDKAFSIRSMLDYTSETLEEEIKSFAESNRLNGIFVTVNVEGSTVGQVISYYSDGNEDEQTWYPYFEEFGALTDGILYKSYSERINKNGYYYDYAMVSRGDRKGEVLCYRKQRIEDVEDERISISNILKSFVFGPDGIVYVTDGYTVMASNVEGKVGMLASDTEVVRELRQSDTENSLIRVKDKDIYYGMRSKCRNWYIYTYMPDGIIFNRRSIILLYTFLIYLITLMVIVAIRHTVFKKKQAEQEKKDEAYRTEKEKLAQKAIRANKAKADFLRRMSHDIRTPINGIRGLVEIGEYYYDDPERQKDCREKIWNVSEYLLDIVNDMLDMNKLSTEDPEWKDEQFSITELFEEVVAFTCVQAKELGITFTSETKNIEHDYLIGGKVQLKRIFTNLISNAIKYNKPSGSVDVCCRETGSEDGIAHFEFKCADTGIGMDEEFIKKMYEPFERENQTDGKTLEGVGLGLSIVKKFIDKAGWNISVDSKKGEGTTFTVNITLKVAEQKTKPIEVSLINDKEKLLGYNILVAEDNELNYEIVEFMLKVAGANVIRAVDGKQAIDIFKNSKEFEIDAILMDVMMPEVDGLTATKEIRNMDRADAKTVPIIAMTASAFADDVENARIAGMNAHIAKPIDREKLIKNITRFKNSGGGALNDD